MARCVWLSTSALKGHDWAGGRTAGLGGETPVIDINCVALAADIHGGADERVGWVCGGYGDYG